MSLLKRRIFQWTWSLAYCSRAWLCCWVSSGFCRGRRAGRCAASRRLLIVYVETLPISPCRSSLICRAVLKRFLLECWMISLSCLSVVTLGRPLLGTSLMFPVTLCLATRQLTSLLVIPKRAAITVKDCPACAAPICHLSASFFLRLAMSDVFC